MLSNRKDIFNCYNSFFELYDEEELNYYFSKREFFKWDDKYESLKKIVFDYSEYLERLNRKANYFRRLKFIYDKYIEFFIIDKEYEYIIKYLTDVFSQGAQFIETRNNRFVEKELQRFTVFFNSVNGKALNKKQREAIVTDEANNLVIAGAGTGKTLVLEGKAGYLIEKGLAKPEEILVLSFAHKVKEELENRLKKNYGIPNIKTFHSFGNSVIGTSLNYKRVSELARDNKKLEKALEGFLQTRISDINFLNKLHRYFIHYLKPVENILDFQTAEEYNEYIDSYEIRSLKGDKVNSFAELEISNFLFLNDINYVWEKEYPFNTASEKYGQYLPDFTLTDYDIYIEHVGIDENCNTAPNVDRWDYLDSWFWKRKIHLENETNLIETYSYEKTSGILLENLSNQLKKREVIFQRKSKDLIFTKIKELGQVTEFVGLLRKFLSLYKSSALSFSDLRKKAQNYPSRQRYLTFIDIFEPIYNDYSTEIRNSGRIDFDDMINEATDCIKNKIYKSNFKYVLVDEFQDISQSRYRLLKTLLEQNEETKLLCVGDDWQSIYRFNGCDLSIMTSFEKFFHPVEKLFLNETFRFNERICDFSSKFIMNNPFQYEKKLISRPAEQEGMTLIWYDNINKGIEEAINDIKTYEDKPEIVLLSRYNLEYYRELDKTRFNFNGNHQVTLYESNRSLPIEPSTIHSFKGKEADYVILVEVKSGIFGFPCEIEDDPVINLVLSEDDRFPFSEERRTFYVGLSRAKKHTYLLADRNRISSFIQEILDGDYNFEILGESPKLITCPDCKKGVINRIKGDEFDFFSCNRFDLCKFRREPCPECGEGVQYLENESDELFTCSNPKCSHQAMRCPDCSEYLVFREGNPDFYGCINFGKTGCRGSQQIRRMTEEIFEDLESIRQSQLSQKSLDYEQEFFNYLKTQNAVNMITATERLTTFGFKYEEAKKILEKWISEGKIENFGFKGIRLTNND